MKVADEKSNTMVSSQLEAHRWVIRCESLVGADGKAMVRLSVLPGLKSGAGKVLPVA